MAEPIVLVDTAAGGTVAPFRSWDEWLVWFHELVTMHATESKVSRRKRIDAGVPTSCVHHPARDLNSETDGDGKAECNYQKKATSRCIHAMTAQRVGFLSPNSDDRFRLAQIIRICGGRLQNQF